MTSDRKQQQWTDKDKETKEQNTSRLIKSIRITTASSNLEILQRHFPKPFHGERCCLGSHWIICNLDVQWRDFDIMQEDTFMWPWGPKPTIFQLLESFSRGTVSKPHFIYQIRLRLSLKARLFFYFLFLHNVIFDLSLHVKDILVWWVWRSAFTQQMEPVLPSSKALAKPSIAVSMCSPLASGHFTVALLSGPRPFGSRLILVLSNETHGKSSLDFLIVKLSKVFQACEIQPADRPPANGKLISSGLVISPVTTNDGRMVWLHCKSCEDIEFSNSSNQSQRRVGRLDTFLGG